MENDEQCEKNLISWSYITIRLPVPTSFSLTYRTQRNALLCTLVALLFIWLAPELIFKIEDGSSTYFLNSRVEILGPSSLNTSSLHLIANRIVATGASEMNSSAIGRGFVEQAFEQKNDSQASIDLHKIHAYSYASADFIKSYRMNTTELTISCENDPVQNEESLATCRDSIFDRNRYYSYIHIPKTGGGSFVTDCLIMFREKIGKVTKYFFPWNSCGTGENSVSFNIKSLPNRNRLTLVRSTRHKF